jgi:hypothetical protein
VSLGAWVGGEELLVIKTVAYYNMLHRVSDLQPFVYVIMNLVFMKIVKLHDKICDS